LQLYKGTKTQKQKYIMIEGKKEEEKIEEQNL
jgi:hypothetical protein